MILFLILTTPLFGMENDELFFTITVGFDTKIHKDELKEGTTIGDLKKIRAAACNLHHKNRPDFEAIDEEKVHLFGPGYVIAKDMQGIINYANPNAKVLVDQIIKYKPVTIGAWIEAKW